MIISDLTFSTTSNMSKNCKYSEIIFFRFDKILFRPPTQNRKEKNLENSIVLHISSIED